MATEPIELDEAAAPQIAAFTRVACAYDLLSTTSVQRAVFADPGPQRVLGVYDGGLDAVALAVLRGGRGRAKSLAVHPRNRRPGTGTALRAQAESLCRGDRAR